MTLHSKTIATAVVAAALLAPVAQAAPPDDRDGPRGPGAFTSVEAPAAHPDSSGAARGPGAISADWFARVAAASVRPDDRGGPRGVGVYSPGTTTGAAQHPDNRDMRGPGAITTTVVAAGSGSFDWGDALIGGLGGIGLALVATGGFFLVLSSQRSRTRVA